MEKINSIKNIYIRKKAQIIIIIIIIIGLVFCQGLSFIQPLTISLSLQHCFSWSASFLSALVTLSPSLKSKIITVHKNTLVWIFCSSILDKSLRLSQHVAQKSPVVVFVLSCPSSASQWNTGRRARIEWQKPLSTTAANWKNGHANYVQRSKRQRNY